MKKLTICLFVSLVMVVVFTVTIFFLNKNKRDVISQLENGTARAIIIKESTGPGFLKNYFFKVLSVRCFDGSDKVLRHFEIFDNLKNLNISAVNVTSNGMNLIGKIHSLETLNLSRNMLISNEDIKKLSNLSHLKSLDLRQTNVTSVGLKYLNTLVLLENLNLNNSTTFGPRIFAGTVDQLKSLKSLKFLGLMGSEMTDNDVKNILENFKALEELNLQNTNITNNCMDDLKKIKNLTSLNIVGTNVTKKCIKKLLEFKNLKDLHIHFKNLNEDDLKDLSRLKCLKTLNIEGVEISKDGLLHLKTMTNLIDLVLDRSTSEKDVDWLREQLPDTKIYWTKPK